MAELKTRRTDQSVGKFLNGIADKKRRQDCLTLVKIMTQATGARPRMWGSSIVGFGDYHYVYESGREGDWFLAGFSPRKQNLTLYLTGGFEQYETLLKKLGKYKTSKACLYIKSVDDIDLPTLKKMLQQSVRHMTRRA